MSEIRICIFCDLGDKVPEKKIASTLLSLAEVRRLGNDGEAIMVKITQLIANSFFTSDMSSLHLVLLTATCS